MKITIDDKVKTLAGYSTRQKAIESHLSSLFNLGLVGAEGDSEGLALFFENDSDGIYEVGFEYGKDANNEN